MVFAKLSLFTNKFLSKIPLVSEAKFPVVYLGLLGTTFVLRETKSGQSSAFAPVCLSACLGVNFRIFACASAFAPLRG